MEPGPSTEVEVVEVVEMADAYSGTADTPGEQSPFAMNFLLMDEPAAFTRPTVARGKSPTFRQKGRRQTVAKYKQRSKTNRDSGRKQDVFKPAGFPIKTEEPERYGETSEAVCGDNSVNSTPLFDSMCVKTEPVNSFCDVTSFMGETDVPASDQMEHSDGSLTGETEVPASDQIKHSDGSLSGETDIPAFDQIEQSDGSLTGGTDVPASDQIEQFCEIETSDIVGLTDGSSSNFDNTESYDSLLLTDGDMKKVSETDCETVHDPALEKDDALMNITPILEQFLQNIDCEDSLSDKDIEQALFAPITSTSIIHHSVNEIDIECDDFPLDKQQPSGDVQEGQPVPVEEVSASSEKLETENCASTSIPSVLETNTDEMTKSVEPTSPANELLPPSCGTDLPPRPADEPHRKHQLSEDFSSSRQSFLIKPKSVKDCYVKLHRVESVVKDGDFYWKRKGSWWRAEPRERKGHKDTKSSTAMVSSAGSGKETKHPTAAIISGGKETKSSTGTITAVNDKDTKYPLSQGSTVSKDSREKSSAVDILSRHSASSSSSRKRSASSSLESTPSLEVLSKGSKRNHNTSPSTGESSSKSRKMDVPKDRPSWKRSHSTHGSSSSGLEKDRHHKSQKSKDRTSSKRTSSTSSIHSSSVPSTPESVLSKSDISMKEKTPLVKVEKPSTGHEKVSEEKASSKGKSHLTAFEKAIANFDSMSDAGLKSKKPKLKIVTGARRPSTHRDFYDEKSFGAETKGTDSADGQNSGSESEPVSREVKRIQQSRLLQSILNKQKRPDIALPRIPKLPRATEAPPPFEEILKTPTSDPLLPLLGKPPKTPATPEGQNQQHKSTGSSFKEPVMTPSSVKPETALSGLADDGGTRNSASLSGALKPSNKLRSDKEDRSPEMWDFDNEYQFDTVDKEEGLDSPLQTWDPEKSPLQGHPVMPVLDTSDFQPPLPVTLPGDNIQRNVRPPSSAGIAQHNVHPPLPGSNIKHRLRQPILETLSASGGLPAAVSGVDTKALSLNSQEYGKAASSLEYGSPEYGESSQSPEYGKDSSSPEYGIGDDDGEEIPAVSSTSKKETHTRPAKEFDRENFSGFKESDRVDILSLCGDGDKINVDGFEADSSTSTSHWQGEEGQEEKLEEKMNESQLLRPPHQNWQVLMREWNANQEDVLSLCESDSFLADDLDEAAEGDGGDGDQSGSLGEMLEQVSEDEEALDSHEAAAASSLQPIADSSTTSKAKAESETKKATKDQDDAVPSTSSEAEVKDTGTSVEEVKTEVSSVSRSPEEQAQQPTSSTNGTVSTDNLSNETERRWKQRRLTELTSKLWHCIKAQDAAKAGETVQFIIDQDLGTLDKKVLWALMDMYITTGALHQLFSIFFDICQQGLFNTEACNAYIRLVSSSCVDLGQLVIQKMLQRIFQTFSTMRIKPAGDCLIFLLNAFAHPWQTKRNLASFRTMWQILRYCNTIPGFAAPLPIVESALTQFAENTGINSQLHVHVNKWIEGAPADTLRAMDPTIATNPKLRSRLSPTALAHLDKVMHGPTESICGSSINEEDDAELVRDLEREEFYLAKIQDCRRSWNLESLAKIFIELCRSPGGNSPFLRLYADILIQQDVVPSVRTFLQLVEEEFQNVFSNDPKLQLDQVSLARVGAITLEFCCDRQSPETTVELLQVLAHNPIISPKHLLANGIVGQRVMAACVQLEESALAIQIIKNVSFDVIQDVAMTGVLLQQLMLQLVSRRDIKGAFKVLKLLIDKNLAGINELAQLTVEMIWHALGIGDISTALDLLDLYESMFSQLHPLPNPLLRALLTACTDSQYYGKQQELYTMLKSREIYSSVPFTDPPYIIQLNSMFTPAEMKMLMQERLKEIYKKLCDDAANGRALSEMDVTVAVDIFFEYDPQIMSLPFLAQGSRSKVLAVRALGKLLELHMTPPLSARFDIRSGLVIIEPVSFIGFLREMDAEGRQLGLAPDDDEEEKEPAPSSSPGQFLWEKKRHGSSRHSSKSHRRHSRSPRRAQHSSSSESAERHRGSPKDRHSPGGKRSSQRDRRVHSSTDGRRSSSESHRSHFSRHSSPRMREPSSPEPSHRRESFGRSSSEFSSHSMSPMEAQIPGFSSHRGVRRDVPSSDYPPESSGQRNFRSGDLPMHPGRDHPSHFSHGDDRNMQDSHLGDHSSSLADADNRHWKGRDARHSRQSSQDQKFFQRKEDASSRDSSGHFPPHSGRHSVCQNMEENTPNHPSDQAQPMKQPGCLVNVKSESSREVVLSAPQEAAHFEHAPEYVADHASISEPQERDSSTEIESHANAQSFQRAGRDEAFAGPSHVKRERTFSGERLSSQNAPETSETCFPPAGMSVDRRDPSTRKGHYSGMPVKSQDGLLASAPPDHTTQSQGRREGNFRGGGRGAIRGRGRGQVLDALAHATAAEKEKQTQRLLCKEYVREEQPQDDQVQHTEGQRQQRQFNHLNPRAPSREGRSGAQWVKGGQGQFQPPQCQDVPTSVTHPQGGPRRQPPHMQVASADSASRQQEQIHGSQPPLSHFAHNQPGPSRQQQLSGRHLSPQSRPTGQPSAEHLSSQPSSIASQNPPAGHSSAQLSGLPGKSFSGQLSSQGQQPSSRHSSPGQPPSSRHLSPGQLPSSRHSSPGQSSSVQNPSSQISGPPVRHSSPQPSHSSPGPSHPTGQSHASTQAQHGPAKPPAARGRPPHLGRGRGMPAGRPDTKPSPGSFGQGGQGQPRSVASSLPAPDGRKQPLLPNPPESTRINSEAPSQTESEGNSSENFNQPSSTAPSAHSSGGQSRTKWVNPSLSSKPPGEKPKPLLKQPVKPPPSSRPTDPHGGRGRGRGSGPAGPLRERSPPRPLLAGAPHKDHQGRPPSKPLIPDAPQKNHPGECPRPRPLLSDPPHEDHPQGRPSRPLLPDPSHEDYPEEHPPSGPLRSDPHHSNPRDHLLPRPRIAEGPHKDHPQEPPSQCPPARGVGPRGHPRGHPGPARGRPPQPWHGQPGSRGGFRPEPSPHTHAGGWEEGQGGFEENWGSYEGDWQSEDRNFDWQHHWEQESYDHNFPQPRDPRGRGHPFRPPRGRHPPPPPHFEGERRPPPRDEHRHPYPDFHEGWEYEEGNEHFAVPRGRGMPRRPFRGMRGAPPLRARGGFGRFPR